MLVVRGRMMIGGDAKVGGVSKRFASRSFNTKQLDKVHLNYNYTDKYSSKILY